jgi:archaellum component FlaF (FlaF/FlaG flagellin family)
MADFDTDHPVTTMINLRGKLYPGMGIILGGPLANIILEEEDMFRNSKYVDVTASRAVGVDYTNDTGKSIMVHVCFDDTNNGSPWINILVDGVMIISDNYDRDTSRVTATYSFIVPPGSVYVVHNPGSWARVTKWTELRPTNDHYDFKWVNVTSNRLANVEYTNSTGFEIHLSIVVNDSLDFGAFDILVDGVVVVHSPDLAFSGRHGDVGKSGEGGVQFTCIIPPRSKYKIINNGNPIQHWSEYQYVG